MVGDPWHCGVLSRLSSATGWDPRAADLIVGTSAGAFTAVSLRSGVAPSDRVAQLRGIAPSAEAAEVYARITTPYAEPVVDRDWRPLSLAMSGRALWPPWKFDPARLVFGLCPRGIRSGVASEQRMNELHPGRWPDLPTWIVAIRTSDGRRIVFGRDDVRGTIGQAVLASSAVPGVYWPAQVGKTEYVDGGVHSATNADLTATLGFDLVIISSPMTGEQISKHGRFTNPLRSWFTKKLRAEVAELRKHDTSVVLIEPNNEQIVQLLRSNADHRLNALRAGEMAADRFLGSLSGIGLKTLFSETADA